MLIQVKLEVTPIWYQFGEALGFDKEVLNKCSEYSPDDSIVEILDQWLRMRPGRRTWSDVSVALRKIKLDHLAANIDKVYETGITIIVLRLYSFACVCIIVQGCATLL